MTNHNDFNDFTLFDIFIKNGLLYLIMSINNDPINNKVRLYAYTHPNLILEWNY